MCVFQTFPATAPEQKPIWKSQYWQKRSRHGCLRSFYFLASSASRGPGDKQRISDRGSTGVLQLWLLAKGVGSFSSPFTFKSIWMTHSAGSQGSCQQQGMVGGLSSLSVELGTMLRGECLDFVEKSLGKSTQASRRLLFSAALRNWSKAVWKRPEGEERLSRAVVYKVCELLINLPDMQDLLLVCCTFPSLWPKTAADTELPSTCLKKISHQRWKVE